MKQIQTGTLKLRVSGILPNMRNIQAQKKTANKQEPDQTYNNFMDDEICEHSEQQVNISLEQKINKKILHHKIKTSRASVRHQNQMHGAPKGLVVFHIFLSDTFCMLILTLLHKHC